MTFGTTLYEGYSSIILDRLVKWFVGTGEFHNITEQMLSHLKAEDFRAESVAPTVVGEWFLDLGLKTSYEKFAPGDGRYCHVTANQVVQVWLLEELYRCFWRTELAEFLLNKEEEEKILRKKHLTVIGNQVMATEWWQTHELAIKRHVKNMKATKKVLEA